MEQQLPSSHSLNIPAGLNVNTNVGFSPTGVIVNNFSPYYIYFPDGLTYCPPWSSGVIMPLGHATQARANWDSSPFGPQIISVPAGVVYTAQLTFTNDPKIALSGGSPIINPYNVAQILIQSFDQPTGVYNYNPATIPSGSVIKNITMSAIVTVGSLGAITVSVSDGVSSVVPLGVMVSSSGVTTISRDFPDLVLTDLNPLAASWTPYINCYDVIGVSVFSVQTSFIFG